MILLHEHKGRREYQNMFSLDTCKVCFGYMKGFEEDEQGHLNNVLDLYREATRLAPEVEKMNQENRAMSVPRRNN